MCPQLLFFLGWLSLFYFWIYKIINIIFSILISWTIGQKWRIVQLNDTYDAYRPIRIYDVDIDEGNSTYTSNILREIERYEEEGRPITRGISQAYLSYCGDDRPRDFIRYYDFENKYRNIEFYPRNIALTDFLSIKSIQFL